jgi:hypothetical protein
MRSLIGNRHLPPRGWHSGLELRRRPGHNGPRGGADWIALYAAIVATAAFGWQAVTYVMGRRAKLRVDLVLLHFLETEEQQREAASRPTTISTPWRLQIEVHNFGRSPVRVRELQIETNRGSSGYEVWLSSDWALPWVLEPGEDRTVFLTDDDVGVLTQGQELHAEAHTPKKTFSSPTLRIGERGPVHELVVVPERRFRELARVTGVEDRFFTMRVTEYGGGPALDSQSS